MSASPWELCYQAAESNLRNLECAVKDVKTAKELVFYTRNRFNEEAISLMNEKTAELERIMSDYICHGFYLNTNRRERLF